MRVEERGGPDNVREIRQQNLPEDTCSGARENLTAIRKANNYFLNSPGHRIEDFGFPSLSIQVSPAAQPTETHAVKTVRLKDKPGIRGKSDEKGGSSEKSGEKPGRSGGSDEKGGGSGKSGEKPGRSGGSDEKGGGSGESDGEAPSALKHELEKAEKFFRANGVNPEQAMTKAVRTHDITFVGETHTYGDLNPHRQAIAKIMKDLPKGTRLAIEFPSELKPVFDEFNKSPKGSEFHIPDKLDSKHGKEALGALRATIEGSPDLVDAWKAARDAGHKVVPVDNDWSFVPEDSPEFAKLDAQRDEHMKNIVKNLYFEDKSSPIVVWLGSLHGTLHSRGEKAGKYAAQRIAEDPDFKKAGGKITSFKSEIHVEHASTAALNPLIDKLDKPLSVPTSTDKKPNPVGSLPMFRPSEIDKRDRPILSDFDNVIVYPKPSLKDELQKMKETKVGEPKKRPDSFVDEASFERAVKILKLDPDTLKTAKSEINKFGDTPEGALGSALKDSRVLCLDLGTGNWWQHKQVSLELMKSLKTNGATHAAFTIPKTLQPVLDEFNRSGTADREKLVGIQGGKVGDCLAATMQAALNNNIKLAAVGDTHIYLSGESPAKEVSAGVMRILKDKGNKVILIGEANEFSSRPNSEGQPSIASLLRKSDVATKTAVAVTKNVADTPTFVLEKSLKQPVAVHLKHTKVLSELKGNESLGEESKLADYDYVILLNK